jgi:intein-encoded DNA endonuclease-like protein
LQLRAKGLSFSAIGKQLGVDPGQVKRWLEGRKPPSVERYNPDLTPSPGLAYLIGFYIGDGRGFGEEKNVRFKLADRDQAEFLSMLLAKILRTTPKPAFMEEGFYCTVYSAAILYDFLRRPLTELDKWIRPCKSDFLRGFFDAEGYVSPYIDRRKEILTKIRIGPANTDLIILSCVRNLLLEL